MVVGGSPPVRVGRRQASKRVSIMDTLFLSLKMEVPQFNYWEGTFHDNNSGIMKGFVENATIRLVVSESTL